MNLREEREKSRLTIYEVAKALDVHPSSVSYHETGTKVPKGETLDRYRQLYKAGRPWEVKPKAKKEKNRIREQRERSRLTVEEVSKILGIKSWDIVCQEQGVDPLTDELMVQYAELFKCQTHELL
jgi:DNA-binding XRE family transcriptional regulator